MGFHQWWLGFQMVFMTRMGIGFFINILFLTHLLIPRCFSCFIFCLLLISHPWTRNNSFKDSWLTRLTQLHQCRGLPFKPYLGTDFSAEHLLGAAVRWSDIQLITSYIVVLHPNLWGNYHGDIHRNSSQPQPMIFHYITSYMGKNIDSFIYPLVI